MTNNNWSSSKISIKELLLWDENARFPEKYFQKPESELIKHFCAKEFKIIELAESIVRDNDLPQLEKLVVRNIDEKNVVVEGNRRLVAYKLLNNPNLAPDEIIKRKFTDLKSEFLIDDNFELECLITDSETEGFRFIERKHLNNNFEVNWGSQEATNHKHRRGIATDQELFKVEIAKIIRELDMPENFKEQILGKGYVSNFWRIVLSSSSQRQYGIHFKDGKLEIKDKDFPRKLTVIIMNLLSKTDVIGKPLDSRSLNKKDDIGKYLKSIDENACKDIEEKIKEIVRNSKNDKDLLGSTHTPSASDIAAKKIRPNPKSTIRKYLIPKTCLLSINNTKINNIYRELRDNLLIDDSNGAVPNATGVLFRVFLEVSLDHYAKDMGHNFSNSDNISKKISWVVDSLVKKGYEEKKFGNIKKVGQATKEQTYLSIYNFHEYVHSSTVQPSSNELKAKWDNLQDFFEILWESINSK